MSRSVSNTTRKSPLKEGNHIRVKEFSKLYISALNYYDLIISKLFRGETVDFDDCLRLVHSKHKEIDFNFLRGRYHETASYEIAEERVNKNFDSFMDKLKEAGLYVK